MKVFTVFTFVAHANVNRSQQRNARQAEVDEKRFSQLYNMMNHYHPNFDNNKYLAYGCNCIMIGEF